MAKDSAGKGKRRSRASEAEAALARVDGHVPEVPVWQRAVGRLTGARACYGKPIEAHGHVVVPVASLRTVGGLGFGNGTPPSGEASATATAGQSSGGGGGGFVDARPLGFIDIGPEGVRYQPIEAGPRARRAGTTALAAIGVVAAVRLLGAPLAGRARVRRRRTAAGPWPGRSLRR